MNLLTTAIAILFLADALFAFTNLGRLEGLIKDHFPKLDVRKVAWAEAAAGLLILLLKAGTNSFI